MRYVIATNNFGERPNMELHPGLIDYYLGKTYIVQGEIYPCTSANISDAKIYTSLKRAKYAIERLEEKVEHRFSVLPIE